MLHQGAVVPAAVEDSDLASRRHFLKVTLNVQLRLLPFRWGRQGDMAEDAGADALHDAMNHSSLARSVTAFEHNHDLGARCRNPFLHFDQLGLEFA